MCVLPISFSQSDAHGLHGNDKEGSSCVFRLFSDEALETSNLLGSGRDCQISTVALNDKLLPGVVKASYTSCLCAEPGF